MHYINLHTHESTRDIRVTEIVNRYPYQTDDTAAVYSIGIHPWKIIPERITTDLTMLGQQLNRPGCIAVGECGLDKRIDIDFGLQTEVFTKQLLLAQQHHKPVIIHCVAAFDELIAIKTRLKLTVPMIIHGFSKSLQLARQLVNNGFCLSFSLRSPTLESVFKNIPDDRIFLETDSSPEPITAVYTRAAQYKQISEQQLSDIIEANYHFIFGSAASDSAHTTIA